jgi:hypothetical protein
MQNQERQPLADPIASAMKSQTLGVPEMVHPYSAGAYGGLAGGLGMVPFAILYGLMSGNGIWYPVNLIAATIIRNWQSASPAQLAQFSVAGLVTGLAIHIAMSTLLGLSFASLLPTLPGTPLVWAFVVGPLLWAGAVFAGLPLFNPVMARLIDLPSFALANISYSLILGTWVARTSKIRAE